MNLRSVQCIPVTTVVAITVAGFRWRAFPHFPVDVYGCTTVENLMRGRP